MPSKRRQKSNFSGKLIAFLIFIIFILILYVGIKKTFEPEKVVPQKKEIDIIKKEQTSYKNLGNMIADITKKFGVPDNLYTQRIKEDGIHIYIGIDKKRFELTYINIVFSQLIEEYNAEVISGWESDTGKSQQIEVIDKNDSQKYFIRFYYDQENSYEDQKPKMAIIIDDFGNISGKLLQQFIEELPKEITFAIMPGRKNSQKTMNLAHSAGHELMIHMPMEPIGYPKNDPGENAIFVELSDEEIKRRVKNYMVELPLCIGANNHMGSLATSKERVMKNVFEAIKDKNLYFVDSKTISSSIAYTLAQKMGIPSFKRDLFLDDPNTSDATRKKKLQIVKKSFDKKKRLVVIAHCHTKKHLENIKKFIKASQKIGYEIVPVSAFYINDFPQIK